MAETERQRKAREANLRKGNPKSYSKAEATAEDPPRERPRTRRPVERPAAPRARQRSPKPKTPAAPGGEPPAAPTGSGEPPRRSGLADTLASIGIRL